MIQCANCNIETPNAKFCSRSCSVALNNRQSPKRKKQSKTIDCGECGKTVAVEGNRTPKYCSRRCAGFGPQGVQDRIQKWLNGELEGTTKTGKTSRFVKKYLVQTYGEKCSLCLWAETNPATGLIPLELDHIDGNWKDSSPSNVRLLCPNCHSLTPTYKYLNSASSRSSRGLEQLNEVRERRVTSGCRNFTASVSPLASTQMKE